MTRHATREGARHDANEMEHLAGVTAASMVLATAQQAADRSGSQWCLKVAYFVLN